MIRIELLPAEAAVQAGIYADFWLTTIDTIGKCEKEGNRIKQTHPAYRPSRLLLAGWIDLRGFLFSRISLKGIIQREKRVGCFDTLNNQP